MPLLLPGVPAAPSPGPAKEGIRVGRLSDLATGLTLLGSVLVIVGTVSRVVSLSYFGGGESVYLAASFPELVWDGFTVVLLALPGLILVFIPPFGFRNPLLARVWSARLSSVAKEYERMKGRVERLEKVAQAVEEVEEEDDHVSDQGELPLPGLESRRPPVGSRGGSAKRLLELELSQTESRAAALKAAEKQVAYDFARSPLPSFDYAFPPTKRQWGALVVYMVVVCAVMPGGLLSAASYLILALAYWILPWIWVVGRLSLVRLAALGAGIGLLLGVAGGLLFAPGWTMNTYTFDSPSGSPPSGLYASLGTSNGMVYIAPCNDQQKIIGVPLTRIITVTGSPNPALEFGSLIESGLVFHNQPLISLPHC